MKKTLAFLLVFMAVSSISALALAAEAAVTTAALDTISNIALAAAIAIGLGVTGPGVAQGLALLGATTSIARNPEMAGFIRTTMLMGLAIIESLAIYALVVALVLLYNFSFNEQLLAIIS
jgi:F-type H+-transporting ATPase subunit c